MTKPYFSRAKIGKHLLIDCGHHLAQVSDGLNLPESNQTLCALARISRQLEDIERALAYRRELDERQLVEYAEELEGQRDQLHEGVEAQITAREQACGAKLDPKVRLQLAEWMYKRNEWQVRFTDQVHRDGSNRLALWRTDGEILAGRVCMPYGWTKRSRRYQILRRWLKRRMKK